MQQPFPGKRKASRDYADALLFTAAYPGHRSAWEQAVDALQQLTFFPAKSRNAASMAGLRGSVITGSFSYALVRWLVFRFPDDVELSSSGADPESVRLFFRQLLPRTEYETCSGGHLSLPSRLKRIRGTSAGSLIAVLIALLDNSGCSHREKETLFHNLQVFIRWQLNHPFFNRTALRLPIASPYIHREIKRQVPFIRLIRQPLPPEQPLQAAKRQTLIDIARCSLAFLYRETEPFTYATAKEVRFIQLSRGMDIALFGMEADRRLSIESYVGYLCFKNGIPVAYGGGWIFGSRCQFGINILPAFRGGESLYLFAQLIRVYHQLFGAVRLVIPPYQFGKNNAEALRSGAFWFYYKAGFRPEGAVINQLARREWQKKQKDPAYRTPAVTLKKLAHSPLFLSVAAGDAPAFDATVLSQRITRHINQNYDGDRQKALADCRKKTWWQLRAGTIRNWKDAERKAFGEWSLLLQATLDINNWTRPQKKALLQLIRTKGSGTELDFIHLFRKHRKLWEDWQQLFHHEAPGEQ